MENDIAQPQSYIASIDHALRLLLMLKVQPRIRVADAADELGVARSTAHRVLGMLVYRGFAVQDPGSRAYRAGPVLVEVGMGALAQLDVRQRARPYLENVAALTGVSVRPSRSVPLALNVSASQPVALLTRMSTGPSSRSA